MDDKLGANDPYRGMDSGEGEIQPDFLRNRGAADKLSKAENAASNIANAVVAAKTGKAPAKAGGEAGAGGVGGAKKAASEGLKSGAERAEASENSPKGLYNNNAGKNPEIEEEPKLKMSKGTKRALRAAAPFAILAIFMVGLIVLLIARPVLMIGALDFNLMKSLGFEGTIAILEKVVSFVTADYLKDGKVPNQYASQLAIYGVDVGQVLANGDFIKTNTYIADAETRDDLVAAVSGFSYISEEEGELAILYNGKIIRADEFVAAVESDPTLYAAYSGAADIGAKYYYSEDVNNVYKDMQISRGSFNDWESTGDYKTDQNKYTEILDKVLNDQSDLEVKGYYNDKELVEEKDDDVTDQDIENMEESEDDKNKGNFSVNVTNKDADTVTSEVAEKTKEYVLKWGKTTTTETGANGLQILKTKITPKEYSGNATERAAQLLNSAISSGEPYLAAKAFVAVEEPVQRARINGDGPVNEVMNMLTRGTEVSYQNVLTGEIETKRSSILETTNFRAAVSDSKYSKDEAANFGRDRVLKVTDEANKEIIQSTTVTSNGQPRSIAVVRNGLGSSADSDTIAKATDSVALAKKNSEVFQTVVGGNRIIEGGSFISNTINMKVVGAMPSNAETIAAYHKETQEALAKKAEAERATKNPFDVSSPYTFLGSIVHNMATVALGNYGKVGPLVTVMNAAASNVGSAIASISGVVSAEGAGENFTTMSGEYCVTIGTTGVEGDLYCTSHNTISDKYKKEDWSGVDDDEYKKFVMTAMERETTVGVKSAETCQAYRNTDGSSIKHFFDNIRDLFIDACAGVPDDIATGSRYAFNGENGEGGVDPELLAGRAVYEEVSSLLSGEKSTAAKIREEYYAKYPKDNSEAGIVARRSGMSKNEASIALAYADYLDVIANYSPSTRFDFTAPVVLVEKPILEKQSDDVALNLYAWYSKETEYSDLRTRNFVV